MIWRNFCTTMIFLSLLATLRDQLCNLMCRHCNFVTLSNWHWLIDLVVLVNTLHNFMVSAQWNASKRNASNVAIFFGNKKIHWVYCFIFFSICYLTNPKYLKWKPKIRVVYYFGKNMDHFGDFCPAQSRKFWMVV